MKSRTLFTALCLLAPVCASAQNMSPEPPDDPVQQAIQEFNEKTSRKANEVTVDLTKDEAASETQPGAQETTPAPEEKPVLVTGKPPEGTELIKEAPAEPQLAETPAAQAPTPAPQKGMAVRVEKLQSGSGSVDPAKIQILAPFPAKPISAAPAGWRLQDSENAPPFTREVELAPGRKYTLTVKPHVLVPDADGVNAFTVMEPGYNPALGYSQESTVGAVLSRSIQQHDEDSKQLGAVVDHLQQLLASLPKPEPQDAPVAEPVKTINHPKR